jgi:hypothetical protein
LTLINAEVVLKQSYNLVREGNVFAAVVGSPGIQAIRGDKDGAVASQRPQPVEITARYVVHGSVAPVISEDNPVSLVGVVVAGQLEDVLPLLAVDHHGFDDAGGLPQPGEADTPHINRLTKERRRYWTCGSACGPSTLAQTIFFCSAVVN